MTEPARDPADPRLSDTVEGDNLLISVATVGVLYEQARLKFPDKNFPADATFEQKVEIFRAFHDGVTRSAPP